MRKSFDYSRHSRVHRHQSQRRLLKKFRLLLAVVGWLMLLIMVVFLGMWLFAEEYQRARHMRMAQVYLGLGVAAFLLRGIVGWSLEVRSRRRRPRHRSRRSAAADLGPAASGEESGSVLVLVLVLTALMSGLVLQAQVAARAAHRLAGARLAETRLRLAATDAVRGAMQVLADDPDLRTDHPGEAWARPRETVDPSGITTRVRTVDLNRYFDLNNLSLPARPSVRAATAVLVDLLSLCGELAPEARADALLDWLDGDDEGFREAAYYREREQPCRPPNRALFAWNELTWVEGFGRDDLLRATRPDPGAPFQGRPADCLVLLPAVRDSLVPVNLNTAAEETILGVVGLANDDLARRIAARREARPLQPADAAALSIDPDLVQQLAPYVAVRSTWFRIEAVAYLPGVSESIEAVVRRDDDGNVEVVQWAL